MTSYLYRHWSIDGQLLYVGISQSWMMRLSQHRDHSHWFANIARVDIEKFNSRGEALQAEMEAIKNEKPIYNVAYQKCVTAEQKLASQQSIDAIVAKIVRFDILYEEHKLPLPLTRKQVRELMDLKKLGFIEFPSKGGLRIKRYVTGWQLIDFLETLQTEFKA